MKEHKKAEIIHSMPLFQSMKNISAKFWTIISLFNLLIVASLGVLMRYKIGFEFLHFNQKFLQEGHSHFAFLGWITQTLMVLITFFLSQYLEGKRLKTYHRLLLLNLFLAYLILAILLMQGYGILFFIFITLSFFASIAFALFCFRDFRKIEKSNMSIQWFKASLIFNLISSAGTFALAIMMLTKNIPKYGDLASEYWYLHFQYNGWFFFASMGLFLNYVKHIFPGFKLSNSIFWLFAISCISGFGLSVLWLKIPLWIYCIIVLGAFAQIIAWIKLLLELKKISFFSTERINGLSKLLFTAVALCLSIKLALQLGSTIPVISQMAFGFRPIVIAYLHLVLLAIFSIFILTFFYTNNLISNKPGSTTGLVIFVAGVFINELILGIQGVASLSYHLVPYVNYLLFGASMVLFTGIIILLFSQFVGLRNK